MFVCVVGVKKMGNIVPRAGIEPIYLACWSSVLPLHHTGSLMSPLYLPYLSKHLLASDVIGDYYTCSPGIVILFNAYNYRHTGNDLTYRYTW